MKLDRLIGILSILLQKDTVTAPYLSEKFEVSRRTIMRDIDALCAAGIPIVTRQGFGGGISIMDGYKLDRTVLSSAEMRDILAGLRSLDSVNGTNRFSQLMEKLLVGSSDLMQGGDTILIDLSSWQKDSLTPKIELIRDAIESRHELCFAYFSPNGESSRCIKPYYLIYHWSSWYVWGYCNKRCDFRMFKLNRMERLTMSEKSFLREPATFPDLSNERIFPGKIHAKALFDPSCKWRLVEEFGIGSLTEEQNGKLLFSFDFTDRENLITWIMTFRDKAEIIEPRDIREEIKASLELMKKVYEK